MVLECEQSHCFLSSNTHTHTLVTSGQQGPSSFSQMPQIQTKPMPEHSQIILYTEKKNPKKYNKIYSLCNLRSFHWTWIQFFLTQCAVHSLMCKFSFIYMSIQDFQTIFLHPIHPHLSQCNNKIESFIHSLHTFTIYKEPF